MNIDKILQTLADHRVDYLLIGGVNFLLRHEAELTFDVDIWVADTASNLKRLNAALIALEAGWGPTETEWGLVSGSAEWLKKQPVYCLTTAFGALDVFREVKGLEGKYAEGKAAAFISATASGVPYTGLSDQHMLDCQQALPIGERNLRRIEVLNRALCR